ncbi:MAG: hypothetical protein V7752_15785, partial [Halopseudomonas sp.]
MTGSVVLLFSLTGHVAAETIDEKIKLLEQALSQQQARIEEQERKLIEQATIISGQKTALESQLLGLEVLRQEVMMDSRGAGAVPPTPQIDKPATQTILLADNHTDEAQKKQPVGKAPAKAQQERPVIVELADIGGVLTPKGKLVLEPAFQYTHSSVNRVTFRGIEILSSLGIGVLEAVDTDRDSVVASLTGRLGLTNRMEMEFKVPYVWRRDTESADIPQLEETDISSTLDGDGVGDLEIALHYQMNNGNDGWPFFILNGRLKLANGKGPFDIDRDEDGIGQELATGSGFYSFEPSITGLYPSAPAVFFGNVGYLFNIKDDVDAMIGEGSTAGAQTIGTVDPGDAFRISFGMAYSINETASFTLGFKNDWIQATETEINGST